MTGAPLTVSAPGRICLFGEHQDYLDLPVIAMAVDRRFKIDFYPDDRDHFFIETPDIKESSGSKLFIESESARHDSDYCWGISKALAERGFTFSQFGRAVFHSEIPFKAGCSSSSAMSAAWARLLVEIGEHPEKERFLQPEYLASVVYDGEKTKFNGAGGMMDQYSCTIGGLVYVYPAEPDGYGVETLRSDIGKVLLIDTGIPKDTQGILSNVSSRAADLIGKASANGSFNLHETTVAGFDCMVKDADSGFLVKEQKFVRDQLINRDLCIEGRRLLTEKKPLSVQDLNYLGRLLTEEHRVLSQSVGNSLPEIDQLLDDLNRMGAYGSKINGSGGGGSCFALVPEANIEESVSLIESRGMKAFTVCQDEGARVEKG